MSEEELKEAQQYNLDYMEARMSEEIFGGDYTSEVELLAAEKALKKLQQEKQEVIKYLEDKRTEYLSLTMIHLWDKIRIDSLVNLCNEIIDKIERNK